LLANEPSESFTFSGLTNSTKNIVPGDIFIALPGAKAHGATYIAEAQKAGAVAVVTDPEGARIIDAQLPSFVVTNPRFILGDLASWFYNAPFRSLQACGITGTNGKTTTSSLLFQLWQMSHREAGMIGTVGISIGRDEYPAQFTTPESPELQATVATMVEQGARNLVMEVSSHSIALRRIAGSHFANVAFTNLTQDHLDFHGDMESYFAAKAKLFTTEYSDQAFINIDDQYGKRLIDICEVPAQSISRSSRDANWHYTKFEINGGGYEVAIRGVGGILIEGYLPLVGAHNLDNALMAIAMAVESGIDPLAISMDMSRLVGPAGRLEKVDIGQQFLALVDYAHTPDAVERVLSAVREITSGRVIAVLGCGGDRDAAKRPLMGAALQSGSDLAIFTSDNPRSEDPDSILDQMVARISLNDSCVREVDRRGAIAIAVSEAQDGDTVILLGKGHEAGQEIMGIKHPFDDRIELARAIERLS
jgi:UDP-N-acetylmuramoyl-L-alanyl-D-glutamate--2,6-diaminopimelate ligase